MTEKRARDVAEKLRRRGWTNVRFHVGQSYSGMIKVGRERWEVWANEPGTGKLVRWVKYYGHKLRGEEVRT